MEAFSPKENGESCGSLAAGKSNIVQAFVA